MKSAIPDRAEFSADAVSHSAAMLEVVAAGLNFPTSLAFDDSGTLHVAEAGLPFGGRSAGGRVWRLASDGTRSLLLDDLRPPINGLMFYGGWFYISEGGHPSRIIRWRPGEAPHTVLENLPGPGNYHTNMTVIGRDERLYFSQGAMTNSGIVGLDAYELGWLRRLPHAHDLPGYEIALAGVNIETADSSADGRTGKTRTGAFVPFGTETKPGQRIAAQLPCTAAVMRCNLDGSGLELVAWGMRNAYGLGFLADGRLLATDQGADDRGSRPIGNVPDLLYEVKPGAWYGWPDFIGGLPVTDLRFAPERGASPTFMLANHHELPPPESALLEFPTHCGALKFAVIPDRAPRFAGQIVIALFGDERPMVAPPGPRAGRALARVNPVDWSLHPLFDRPLHRPIDVAFHPHDGGLLILDFGEFEMGGGGNAVARLGSGRLWRLPLDQL